MIVTQTCAIYHYRSWVTGWHSQPARWYYFTGEVVLFYRAVGSNGASYTIVSDYENAKDFYVNKLGLSVIRENYRPERKDWKLDLRVNEHTELEIFAEENPPKRVSHPEACGLRHLAFCVESVEETVRELAEQGITCEPVRIDDYTGKKMTFFHDPDGLPLELHE